MNDALVPNWIKEMESEAELAKAQSEAAAQRQIAATLTVEAEGPEFWRQLHKELAINADALPKHECIDFDWIGGAGQPHAPHSQAAALARSFSLLSSDASMRNSQSAAMRVPAQR